MEDESDGSRRCHLNGRNNRPEGPPPPPLSLWVPLTAASIHKTPRDGDEHNFFFFFFLLIKLKKTLETSCQLDGGGRRLIYGTQCTGRGHE